MPNQPDAESEQGQEVSQPILQGRPEVLPIGQIRPNPDNPRSHNRRQRRVLTRSIRLLGYNAPILIDGSGMIVSGEARYEVLRELGVEEVLVIRLEHLTKEQVKAFVIADNRIAELSGWDDRKLAASLLALSQIALSFDLEVTGFEPAEIDLRIQSLQPPEIEESEGTLSPQEGPAVSRVGDRWSLGAHHLLCGDAREQATYESLLVGEKAATMVTDPPYGVRIQGHVSGKGRRKHREFPSASGEMTREEYFAFLSTFMRTSTSFLALSATNFVFMDWRHIEEISSAIRDAGQDLLNLCVWAKTNGGMGTLYRSQHELVFVTGQRGEKRINNVQLGKFGRYRTNVWTYPGMNSFARRGQVKGVDLHPTTKPVALIADAILDVTARGDIVLDPFCGSGTLFIAAQQTGRRGYGIELDPGYVDLAINRWQRFTGEIATHASGKTFAEIAAERLGSSTEAAS